MPKFNAYVSVYKDPAEHVEFAPGDDVPDWALPLVGDHVLDDREEETDVRLTDPHYEEDEDAVQFSTPITLPTDGSTVADDVDEDADESKYADLSKDELKEIAEERGLAVSGTKAELRARLEEDDEDSDEDDEE